MTTHPNLENQLLCIFFLLCPLLFIIAIEPWGAWETSEIAHITTSILLIGLIAVPSEIWIIMLTIASCKHCEYTEKGCTVSFLGYHKTYLWSEITSKYYDSFAGTMRGRYYKWDFDDGVFFSTHKYKRSNRALPNQYAARHPFSSFYVVFPPEYLNKTDKFLGLEIKYAPPAYMVDRDEFLALLESWGVELTDIRASRPPRNQ